MKLDKLNKQKLTMLLAVAMLVPILIGVFEGYNKASGTELNNFALSWGIQMLWGLIGGVAVGLLLVGPMGPEGSYELSAGIKRSLIAAPVSFSLIFIITHVLKLVSKLIVFGILTY